MLAKLISDKAAYPLCLITHDQDDPVDSGVGQCRQAALEKRLAVEFDHAFGLVRSLSAKPPSHTGCKNYRLHRFREGGVERILASETTPVKAIGRTCRVRRGCSSRRWSLGEESGRSLIDAIPRPDDLEHDDQRFRLTCRKFGTSEHWVTFSSHNVVNSLGHVEI